MAFPKASALLLLVTCKVNAGGLLDLLSPSNDKKIIERKEPARTSGEAIDFSKSSTGTPGPDDPVEYGVDVSFPIQHKIASQNYEWLPHNLDPEHHTAPRSLKEAVIQPLGDRQKFYDDFLNGCVEYFGSKGQRCRSSEEGRIAMSLRQPQSMTNYTDVGYKKIRAPPEVMSLISEFWEANKERGTLETWGTANTYTNNWASPTYMVSVENNGLRGGGSRLKQKIWDAARDTIQEWTNQELTQCSLYGIRIYTEDSILSTHVDRLPLVSSAIINVAQDVDEPWPIEVYGHDGKATNVTMEPGDMVMYESHSVLHGRPFPLKGRYYANVFIHFEPVGHTLRHNRKAEEDSKPVDVHEKYRNDVARGVGGHEVDQAADSDLPPYIIPGSPEEANWRQRHPNNKRSVQRSFATATTGAHTAAQNGDLVGVKKAVIQDKSVVNKADSNGWTALHESARAGHKEIVKYLYESGADLNARTNNGKGGTAMYFAKKKYGDDHEVVSYLESLGALDVGPDL
mmetsp:Transcript_8069/g.11725  ORF Transcript_8069/g.11725 Transcript_8069/m.11725 type:complete len:513 (+) Transcript_8069:63-1601(+)|eukprot:CAMPEP_0194201640 /NCGR_PEP_ID=MMETSP0156-20130528/1860_1 /TAXON_ID=33649 /ORGANISM="Thalassionema nitzschioides, Strain L26-B" /LENGTH=512 /DNA_ID=CAMNT_0038926881 /DNA_START=56 /DNA_END=1594 /DNA_ORIENTATION=+